MHKIFEAIGKTGIVPVIKIDDPKKAAPLAKALIAGGIPVAEITFRTAQGEEGIRGISKEVPDCILGAGTVLTTDQVDRAINSGAQFIVSPGFNPKVVSYALAKGIPIIPGCSNPSDLERALEAGLEVVKFFPAEQAGGLDYIKAVAAPYTALKFIPTGGINAGNIAKYTAFNKILACGGSWMVAPELIEAGKFQEITNLCREAVLNMLGFSVAHFGINAGTGAAADQGASFFKTHFGFSYKDGSNSVFASEAIEFMKFFGTGTKGHIGIGTNNIVKAVAHLERQGVVFDYANVKQDDKGNMTLIYIKQEVQEFAVHLVQRK